MNAPIKATVTLEPRPLYGIGTVARLTGLKSDTLRVWERRYGLGASYKSATGRRQYTQSDLDHLQLVSALVKQGVRIGEIAASDRKTLEVLLEQQNQRAVKSLPPSKPRVVFVGAELCRWIDGHQGCISGVSALLARMPVDDAIALVDKNKARIYWWPTAHRSRSNKLEALRRLLRVWRAAHDCAVPVCQRAVARGARAHGHSALEYPVEPSRLAFEMGRVQVEKETAEGIGNLSDLMPAKPRLFSDQELLLAAEEKSYWIVSVPDIFLSSSLTE